MVAGFTRFAKAPTMPDTARSTPAFATGRPPGDHGDAAAAIDFALDEHEADPANQVEFLRAWREGAAGDEWPEFYAWLAKREGR